jgi:hypothetical protein
MNKSNASVSNANSKITAVYLRQYTKEEKVVYLYGLHLSPEQVKLYKAFKEKDPNGKFEIDKETQLPLYWTSEHLGDTRAMSFNSFSGGVFKDDSAMQSFIAESKLINQMLASGSTGNEVADQAMQQAVGNYKAQQIFATLQSMKGNAPKPKTAEPKVDTFEEETFGPVE